MATKKAAPKKAVAKLRTYYTHDNGGRPFRVVIKGTSPKRVVKVFLNEEYDEKTEKFISNGKKEIAEFTTRRIFIGKSPLTPITEFSGGYGREYDGNTILLSIGNGQYVYIGDRVFSFLALSKIIKYVSEVGNNDVPYPYAIDEMGNIYLIAENIIITNKNMTKKQMKDPYYYYDYYDIEKIKIYNKSGEVVKNLSYDPFPENNYEHIFKEFPVETKIVNEPLYDSPLFGWRTPKRMGTKRSFTSNEPEKYYYMKNGKLKLLSHKSQYITLNDNYGKTHFMEPLYTLRNYHK